jgi:hypothetical protein
MKQESELMPKAYTAGDAHPLDSPVRAGVAAVR